LEAKIKKREDLDRHVDVLRRDLERLNTMRNNLYADIGNEERNLKEKENEKNRLIVQKSSKLQDLAEKEKQMHEKEQKNEELRRLVDSQKQKLKKVQGELDPRAPSAEPQEETKAKPVAGQALLDNDLANLDADPPVSPQLKEERERLDKMRTDKFKFIMDAMASHAIEE
jgi:DNA repair exonuclease SbcCD ATPase subunit